MTQTPAGSLKISSCWESLADQFLPLTADGEKWRYSRLVAEDDPDQGWKIHISATILNAGEILAVIGPFLKKSCALFKAPVTLFFLGELNSGVRHGYSQVGKVFTVYPRSDAEALRLAARLDDLTRDFGAPEVPFDRRFAPGSNVYYRYGAFRRMVCEVVDHEPVSSIVGPEGELVPDRRDIAVPEWIDDIFQPLARVKEPRAQTPLSLKYHIFRAFKQRGKGGVYQAIDVSHDPPRICVVKEGRRHGETGWDGSDGRSMVENEADVLKSLEAVVTGVPEVFDSFAAGEHFYLVQEFVEGDSLDKLLRTRRRRLDFATIGECAAALARLIESTHKAGWVWRDCKPGNLMVGPRGELRPIDFEGACRIGEKETAGWWTAGFSPPAISDAARPEDDIFSFGAVLYFLITGRLFDTDEPVHAQKYRRGIPFPLRRLLEDCLTPGINSSLTDGRLSRRCHEVVRVIESNLRRRSAGVPQTSDPVAVRRAARREVIREARESVLRMPT